MTFFFGDPSPAERGECCPIWGLIKPRFQMVPRFLFLPLLRGVNSSRLDGFFCVRLIFSCHQKALIFLEMQFPSSTTFEGLAFRGARPCQFCVHFLLPANCAKPTKKSVLRSPYYYKNKGRNTFKKRHLSSGKFRKPY